jgi:hypothetical protein
MVGPGTGMLFCMEPGFRATAFSSCTFRCCYFYGCLRRRESRAERGDILRPLLTFGLKRLSTLLKY